MTTNQQKLAMELNWHKRQCMGASGTVIPRFERREYPPAQKLALEQLENEARHIVSLLRAHVENIETFWVVYGSERGRRELIRKQELREKARAWFMGTGPEPTEQEWSILYSTRKHKFPTSNSGNQP